jgi:hypothetical protein
MDLRADATQDLNSNGGTAHGSSCLILKERAKSSYSLGLFAGEPEPFAAAVVAGNVMPYLAPGTEQAVLTNVAARLREDAFVVVGFGLDRGYSLSDFDTHAAGAGLRLEHRFATWDLRPSRDDSRFAVTVLRVP